MIMDKNDLYICEMYGMFLCIYCLILIFKVIEVIFFFFNKCVYMNKYIDFINLF